MSNCPCGSGRSFEECCAPFISGEVQPSTAEQLMRSRYTAYTRSDIPYLKKTLASDSAADFDAAGAKAWSSKADWKGLKILSTEAGGPGDKKGVVEFVATYVVDGEEIEHHEVSQFKKDKHGAWKFVDGDAHTHKGGEGHHHHHAHGPVTPVVRESPKVGRNDPCPCGSGKKFKKCCLNSA